MNKKIALLLSEGVDYKFLYEELKKVYPCVDLFKSEFSHLRKDIVTPVHKLIVRNLSNKMSAEEGVENENDYVPFFSDKIIVEMYDLLWKSNMKKNHEIKNNFTYDICININKRFDKLSIDYQTELVEKLSKFKIKNSTIHILETKGMITFPFHSIDYSMFCTDSISYDMMGTIYKNLPYMFAPHDYTHRVKNNLPIFKNNEEDIFYFYAAQFDFNLEAI